MVKPPKTIGVILAGGKSRRMGRDKALLSVGETTLLELMQTRLEALTCLDEIVISRDQAVPPRARPSDKTHRHLLDIKGNLGPIGALHTLANHYPNCRTLIIPVDMPLLELSLLEQLCRTSHTEGTESSALYYEGYYLPLMLTLNEATATQLARRVAADAPDRSIASLLADLGARVLTAPADLAQFANINTFEDWQKLRGSLSLGH